MEEIILDKIEWSAKEYEYKEKSVDSLWTIGLIALVGCGIAIWLTNYLFAIFILISGASLIMLSVRHPSDMNFVIETEGFTMGKDKYPWKKIKSFDIKKKENEAIFIVELDKYMLPVCFISLPLELVNQVRENISKVAEAKEINESPSMKFMEKIGF